MTFKAHIQRDPWFGQNVRLLVARASGVGHYEVLLQDGSWGESDPAAETPDAGVELPAEALQAIHDAIAEHLGKSLPTQAEISVLREWLDVERGRVDDVLKGDRP